MALKTFYFVSRSGGAIPNKFYVGDYSELPTGNEGDLLFALDTGHFYSSNGVSLTEMLDSSSPIVSHHTSHENSGSDEIDLTGLSGLLADNQNPVSHHTSHESGGSDEITITESQVTNLTTDLSARELIIHKNAASGYAGLDVSSKLTGSQQTYGSSSNTACEGNDSRLSDTRVPTSHKTSHQDGGSDEISVTGLSGLLGDSQTPLAHASSHISAGSDALTLSESQITNLTTDLAAKVASTRSIISGAGLTGGGDLSADRTLAIGAGTGITVNADDIAVNYGTSGSTACVGNDSRLSDSRIPTSHASTHAHLGSDAVTITYSDLSGIPSTFSPSSHASSHNPGGSDALTTGTSSTSFCIGNDSRLSDSRTPSAHKTSHQSGGSDEISVAGLTGLLGTSQTPAVHVTNHYPNGSDPILQFPTYPTTLLVNQTILTGYNAWLNGTITIPSGITLTVQGTGQVQIGSSSIINIA